MKKSFFAFLMIFAFVFAHAQSLSVKLEELTAPEFISAVEKSSKTAILPIGVYEKHGAHLPLGTDVFIARELALRAAAEDYTVVFPPYYFSQINEARHQPGTIAYSPSLIWQMLQETLDELNRNGFTKIIIVNGHGGNSAFLNYFGMAQLSERRNYTLYWFQPTYDQEVMRKAEALSQRDIYDQHGGNRETNMMLDIAPELVYTGRAGEQSGVDLGRMNHLQNIYSGIWWYARYPNHYSGDGSKSTPEAGKLIVDHLVAQLVRTIRSVKQDEDVPGLQNQFFDEAENPLKTKQ